MPTKSSKKNRYLKAACTVAALLLCLGGFFVFFAHNSQLSSHEVGDSSSSLYYNTTLFIPAASQVSLGVSAKSAILIEAGSGEVIYEKNADARLPMASTTKIMTALVALEEGEWSREVSVSPSAIGVEGSSVYLYPDEKLSLEDLIYAMLLESANDAAAAIAIEIGGSIEGFADMMNQKALELGLKNTHFENPHGLDGENHYTTARELALIAREAYSNDKFREIVSTYKKTIPLNEGEGVRMLVNHNKLLKSYDGATGIKTGYTKKSGRCLVSAASRDSVEFIAVTLNAPDDWRDHSSMLDLGFSLFESRTLCTAEEFCYILPVVGGDVDHVRVCNSDSITVILPRGASEISYKVELSRFEYAPISSGEIMGRLVFYLDGEEIASSPLLSVGDASLPRGKISLFGRGR